MSNPNDSYPLIIQAGMGFNVSTLEMAKEMATMHLRMPKIGRLQGTVSGTALEAVVGYMLREGDLDGNIRRALSHFPFPDIAKSVMKNFFIEGGIKKGQKPPAIPMWSFNPPRHLIELVICSNYAIVWLAKEGHDGIISINYLEKIAMPHIYAITGALLARVDCVTMGAGMPNKAIKAIRAIIGGETASYIVPVKPRETGRNITEYKMGFNPAAFLGGKLPQLKKPRFLPIISSNLLADGLMRLVRRGELAPDDIDGFVLEGNTSGGHNALPREKDSTEYGKKDEMDPARIAEHGLPFWIGGSYGNPEGLVKALELGAAGIQVGSLLAMCKQSGFRDALRQKVRELSIAGKLKIKTDFEASPTGYVFKVTQLDGTISDATLYENRDRVCNKGFLRHMYERADGSIGLRCPSEPVEIYIKKGGLIEDTVNRRCLCNGLGAAVGIDSDKELALVTLGNGIIRDLPIIMRGTGGSYTARDAVEYLFWLKFWLEDLRSSPNI